jgi:hypothetical protein
MVEACGKRFCEKQGPYKRIYKFPVDFAGPSSYNKKTQGKRGSAALSKYEYYVNK